MEELARSISDLIGSSWRALALMDRVRDRISDRVHFKAANRAIASDAAGILAAIQRIVRRRQRLVRPARCSSSGTLDLASRRDGKAPEDAETIDAAGGSECREHDLQSRGHELDTRSQHSIRRDRSVVAVDRAREAVSISL
jgi:hypothetical protein